MFESYQVDGGLVGVQSRWHIGVLQREYGDAIEQEYAFVLESEVEYQRAGFVLVELLIGVPEREIGGIKSNEDTATMFQPSYTSTSVF